MTTWQNPSKGVAYRALSDNSADTSITISFRILAVVTVLLPVLALMVCIVWSLLFHLEASTSTHCGVTNFLPSISAAIGAFEPQKYIWRIAIALHSMTRYLVAFMYYNRYRVRLVFAVNLIEVSSLLGLTYVSSTESFAFHSRSFTTFMLTAFIGMVLHWLYYDRTNLKRYLLVANLVSALFAVYFYLRHNKYCETGVYTLFAICEYCVVLTNCLFHFQAYHDFRQTFLVITDRRHYTIDHLP